MCIDWLSIYTFNHSKTIKKQTVKPELMIISSCCNVLKQVVLRHILYILNDWIGLILLIGTGPGASLRIFVTFMATLIIVNCQGKSWRHNELWIILDLRTLSSFVAPEPAFSVEAKQYTHFD